MAPKAMNNKTGSPSAPLPTMDDAAEHCIRLIARRSIDENVEYYAVIFARRNPATGCDEYSYTPPSAGTENSSAGLIPLFLKSLFLPGRPVATVHTHGAYGGDCTDVPSNADVNVLGALGTAYIATPSGNVYKIEKAKGFPSVTGVLLGAWQAGFHVRPMEGLTVWKSGFPSDQGDPNR